MYKNLEKVYIKNIEEVSVPLDNKLYLTNDEKLFIWNSNIEQMQEIASGDEISDSYSKAEVDALLVEKANVGAVYNKTQTYNKDEVDTKLNDKANTADIYNKSQVDSKLADKADKSALDAKANSTDVYKKTETYSKGEIDAQLSNKANTSDVYSKSEIDEIEKAQDERIEALETGGVTPGDTYTKGEVDAKLNDKADTSALDAKANTSDIYSNTQIDNKLADKGDKSAVDANTADIVELKAQSITIPAKATALTRSVDNVNSETTVLTVEASPKFYPNGNGFSVVGNRLTNGNRSDASNQILVTGDIQLVMAGLISAITTVTISCAGEVNGVTKRRQFTISSESAFAIPFSFVLPGDQANVDITVTFSGLSGLTSRQIRPSYIHVEKLR